MWDREHQFACSSSGGEVEEAGLAVMAALCYLAQALASPGGVPGELLCYNVFKPAAARTDEPRDIMAQVSALPSLCVPPPYTARAGATP